LHPRKTAAAQLRAAIVACAIGVVVSGVILVVRMSRFSGSRWQSRTEP
jgi:hypothetical protein